MVYTKILHRWLKALISMVYTIYVTVGWKSRVCCYWLDHAMGVTFITSDYYGGNQQYKRVLIWCPAVLIHIWCAHSRVSERQRRRGAHNSSPLSVILRNIRLLSRVAARCQKGRLPAESIAIDGAAVVSPSATLTKDTEPCRVAQRQTAVTDDLRWERLPPFTLALRCRDCLPDE